MERVVQQNKANKQLFVTIPRNSGIKEKDVVKISKKNNLEHLALNLYNMKKGDTTSVETEDRLIVLECKDDFRKG